MNSSSPSPKFSNVSPIFDFILSDENLVNAEPKFDRFLPKLELTFAKSASSI